MPLRLAMCANGASGEIPPLYACRVHVGASASCWVQLFQSRRRMPSCGLFIDSPIYRPERSRRGSFTLLLRCVLMVRVAGSYARIASLGGPLRIQTKRASFSLWCNQLVEPLHEPDQAQTSVSDSH